MELTPETNKGLPGLAFFRKERGMTQEALAEKVGLHKITVTNYERGAQDPGMATLRLLAAALDCTPADLLTAPEGVAADG